MKFLLHKGNIEKNLVFLKCFFLQRKVIDMEEKHFLIKLGITKKPS